MTTNNAPANAHELAPEATSLAAAIEQAHRDGKVTLTYNPEDSIATMRVPYGVLPDAVALAAAAANLAGASDKCVEGLTRFGKALFEDTSVDEAFVPGSRFASLMTHRLAIDLLAHCG